jgi:oxaloacetate decarboxylase beta subunit
MFTSKADRSIVMTTPRTVSQTEKILLPIVVAIFVGLVLPAAVPLIGMMMFGNFLRESKVVERLSNSAQNEICNITTIFLGLTVGATMKAEDFLKTDTLMIVGLGLVAFMAGTAMGVIFGQVMKVLSGGRINPVIGAAGVSAVPMAARTAHLVGQEANPRNFLLMHAMGPNVAGVIGTAVAASVLLSLCG